MLAVLTAGKPFTVCAVGAVETFRTRLAIDAFGAFLTHGDVLTLFAMFAVLAIITTLTLSAISTSVAFGAKLGNSHPSALHYTQTVFAVLTMQTAITVGAVFAVRTTDATGAIYAILAINTVCAIHAILTTYAVHAVDVSIIISDGDCFDGGVTHISISILVVRGGFVYPLVALQRPYIIGEMGGCETAP